MSADTSEVTSEAKPEAGGSPLWRVPALLVSFAFIAATVWPALRDPPEDSFPLSTYPMFSWVRKTAWIHVVVGFDAAGVEQPIPPRIVANREVMQAAQTIRQAVRKRRAKQLCAGVGERLAEIDADEELGAIVRVEVQSRRLNPRTYFAEPGGKTPLKMRRRARCAVPGRAPAPRPADGTPRPTDSTPRPADSSGEAPR